MNFISRHPLTNDQVQTGGDEPSGRKGVVPLAATDADTSCVVVQSPSFYGHLIDLAPIAEKAHAAGALVLGPIAAEQSTWLGLLVTAALWVIVGLGTAPMVPSFFSAAGHIQGLSTAQVLSRMSIVNQLLVLGSKTLMGALAQGVGLVIAFLMPMALLMIAGLLAATVARRSKRQDAVDNAFPATGPLTIVDEL